MAIVVHKYGGTSVASAERIHAIADRVIASHLAGDQPIVVVSAMGETTDHLMGLARQITSEPNQRELDMLLTAGERISMALLALALQERGARAISFTGSQSGIITDERHGRARITEIRPHRLRAALDQEAIVIVAGFQGVSREKEVTTLGRGGSDTTAVAIAATFNAPCILFTDVDGIYSADPHSVSKARRIPRISGRLLSILAHRGAQVVHARAIDLAIKLKVPLEIRSSLNDKEGTVVVHDSSMEGPEMRAVSAKMKVRSFIIKGTGTKPGALAAILETLSGLDVPLELLDAREVEGVVEISWPLSEDEATQFEGGWQTAGKPAGSWTLHSTPNRALVSLVGIELSGDADTSLEATKSLADAGIPVHGIRTSSSVLTFVIDSDRTDEAVQCLHKSFVEQGSASSKLL